MIDNNIKQYERLEKLNVAAIKELSILSNNKNILSIEKIAAKRNINKNNLIEKNNKLEIFSNFFRTWWLQNI